MHPITLTKLGYLLMDTYMCADCVAFVPLTCRRHGKLAKKKTLPLVLAALNTATRAWAACFGSD